jgi:hypothetical protein
MARIAVVRTRQFVKYQINHEIRDESKGVWKRDIFEKEHLRAADQNVVSVVKRPFMFNETRVPAEVLRSSPPLMCETHGRRDRGSLGEWAVLIRREWLIVMRGILGLIEGGCPSLTMAHSRCGALL